MATKSVSVKTDKMKTQNVTVNAKSEVGKTQKSQVGTTKVTTQLPTQSPTEAVPATTKMATQLPTKVEQPDNKYFASFTNKPPEDENDDYFRFKLTGGVASALATGSGQSQKLHGETIMAEDFKMFKMANEIAKILLCAKSFEVKKMGKTNVIKGDADDDLKSVMTVKDDLKSMKDMKSIYENEKSVVSAVEVSKFAASVVQTAKADPTAMQDPKKKAAHDMLKEAMDGKRQLTQKELAEALAALSDEVTLDRDALAPMLAFMTEKGILNADSIGKITEEIAAKMKTGEKLVMKDIIPMILKYADMSKLP